MPKMKLSDIGKLSRGKSKHRPRNDKILYGGKYPFIQTSDIKNANHILQTYEQTYNEAGLKQSKLWSKNTICITIAANIADSAILGFDACFPDSVIGLTVNDKIANYHYVEYLLQYYKKNIQMQSNGTSQENINLETFEQVLFDIPSLQKQEYIAHILYTLDKKISLNNKINQELEQMAKTLYDYWFVQFDFPDEKGRPYKSANGKMVYNEILKREIPEGWEVIKFDDLIEKAPKLKAIKAPDYRIQGCIPIVDQASTLITGRTDDMSYYFKNERNCVVFGDVTTYFKYINFPFAKGTDGTKIINAKKDRIPAVLLYQMLKDIQLPNIGFARHYMFLREINLLLPPKYICESYFQATKGIMDLRAKNIEENYKLSLTRDFLLPLLMNGQVSVQN